MSALNFVETDDGWDLSGQGLTGRQLPEIAKMLRSTADKFAGQVYFVDLGNNYLKVKDLDVLVQWLKGFPRLHIVVNENCFTWSELQDYILKSKKPALFWMIKEGRLIYASTELHSLTEAVVFKQLERLVETTENVEGWLKKENFAVEVEINRALYKYYEGMGYQLGTLLPGALAGGRHVAGICIQGPNGNDSYSFDGAYLATKGEEKLVLLGEVKHSLEEKDLSEFLKKLKYFKLRMQKMADGTLPEGAESYVSQNTLLRRALGAIVTTYVGGVHIDANALLKAAKEGVDVVMPDGGRFAVKPAQAAEELAKAWLENAPRQVEEEVF